MTSFTSYSVLLAPWSNPIFLSQIVPDNLCDPSSVSTRVVLCSEWLSLWLESYVRWYPPVMITGRVAGRVIVLVMFDMFPLWLIIYWSAPQLRRILLPRMPQLQMINSARRAKPFTSLEDFSCFNCFSRLRRRNLDKSAKAGRIITLRIFYPNFFLFWSSDKESCLHFRKRKSLWENHCFSPYYVEIFLYLRISFKS